MDAPTAGIAAVELNGVAVRRGRRLVLHECTVSLGPGITAVVGRNGSGKTSLVRTIATVVPPAAGRLLLAGFRADRHRERQRARQALGYVPQEWALPEGARVEDALRHAAWLHRVPDADRAVAEAADRLGLASVRRERLGRLSTGTRRRVAIAQGIVHEPAVLILDEPTAGLDEVQRGVLWTVLRARAERTAVVLVTHDLDEVVQHSHTSLLVADGTVRPLATGEHPRLALAPR
jgi:ABC-2 type transport system ATP-binding protein